MLCGVSSASCGTVPRAESVGLSQGCNDGIDVPVTDTGAKQRNSEAVVIEKAGVDFREPLQLALELACGTSLAGVTICFS